MKRRSSPVSPRSTRSTSRTEQLLDVINHCRAAKALADDLDDRFLAYMLAMTLEEANTTLRREQGVQRTDARVRA